jgi:hypothetical protein
MGKIRRYMENYIYSHMQSRLYYGLVRCQAPIWGLLPDFYYCQTDVGL